MEANKENKLKIELLESFDRNLHNRKTANLHFCHHIYLSGGSKLKTALYKNKGTFPALKNKK